MRGILAISVALAMFATLEGCDSLKPDTGTLQSTTSAAVERPRCDACHGNPPNTGFHRYHIDTLGLKGNSTPGIPVISCISCHSATIAHATGRIVVDSVFSDTSFSTFYHTSGWPWRRFTQGTDTFYNGSADTMLDPPWGSFQASPGQPHPNWTVVAAPHPDSMGHMNGRVDIRFQNGVDWNEEVHGTTLDGSDTVVGTIHHAAAWNPVRMSCGMVACHGHEDGRDSDTSTYYLWNKGKRAGH